MSQDEMQLKNKTWFIALWLVLFFPVGLYFMWKQPRDLGFFGKQPVKIVTSLALLLFVVFSGNTKTSNTTNTDVNTAPPATQNAALTTTPTNKPTPKPVAKPEFSPKYVVVKHDPDVNYANIIRKVIRITLPDNLSKQEVEENLKHAAWNEYNKEKPNALMVYAYRQSDNYNGGYTVGQAILAPNGKWENAGENGPMQVSINLGTTYFEKPEKTLKAGTKVKLKDEYDPKLGISGKLDKWNDEDFIVKVPNGTNAEIVEVKKQALSPGFTMTRYRVKVKYKGKTYIGWVNESDMYQ